MSELRVGMTGFDITPWFYPTCGAWGTTPEMTELDMPLLGRCLVLEDNQQPLIWFSAGYVGEFTSLALDSSLRFGVVGDRHPPAPAGRVARPRPDKQQARILRGS